MHTVIGNWFQFKIHVFVFEVEDESLGGCVVEVLKLRPNSSEYVKGVIMLLCQQYLIFSLTRHFLYVNVVGVVVV